VFTPSFCTLDFSALPARPAISAMLPPQRRKPSLLAQWHKKIYLSSDQKSKVRPANAM
jgi:hypothetical protein